MNSDGFLTAQSFDTEINYDKLCVGGLNYSGSVGPVGVTVQTGSTISWESDRSLTRTGWLICWSGSSPAPTTAAPTTTAALVTKQSLLDLYWSTNGPGWLRSTNWGTDVFYCRWHGVICQNNEVVTLNLPWNSLSGSLPASLSSLTGLSDVVTFPYMLLQCVSQFAVCVLGHIFQRRLKWHFAKFGVTNCADHLCYGGLFSLRLYLC